MGSIGKQGTGRIEAGYRKVLKVGRDWEGEACQKRGRALLV